MKPRPFLLLWLVTLIAPPSIPADNPAGAGITGLIPSLCLFCLDCGDNYAHRISPRTFSWGVRTAAGTVTAVGEIWDRKTNGALRVPPLPMLEAGATVSDMVALIDGEWFDIATIYVLYRDEWTNLAYLYEMPGRTARETLPIWVRIERAPFRESPDIEDGLLSLSG